MEILTNPVLISVVVMLVLCLLKINVMFSLLVAAIVGGFFAGISNPLETMSMIIGGMAGKNNVAFSYILLGAMAAAIAYTGIVKILCLKLIRLFGDRRKVTVLVIAGVASLSQNVIPVHIAFIPILIPPMLYMFNKMGLDRRAVALSLVFGLKAPYMIVPMGFGLMFAQIVSMNMAESGMFIYDHQVALALLIPVLVGMGGGLLVATFVTYRKRREYEQRDIELAEVKPEDLKFTKKHTLALIAIFICFAPQMILRLIDIRFPFAGFALHSGALAALLFMIITGVIPFKQMNETVKEGIKLMGSIAFIMLSAGGFAAVMRYNDSYYVHQLVDVIISGVGTNQFVIVVIMFVVGIIITMGIGTSFGTVPIIAPIFVPLAMAAGMSTMATIVCIGATAAIGDASSPASDSTLGTSAGLIVDGQHDHIYDTCVPAFFHFDLPLIVVGIITAAFIF